MSGACTDGDSTDTTAAAFTTVTTSPPETTTTAPSATTTVVATTTTAVETTTTAAPAEDGCVTCHTDENTLRAMAMEPVDGEVLSEGEG